ncbi:methyltransferase domain-containing protein [Pendulispora albinea]|uniref:Class I SAM-dependent methyltransferase n=1 Tax=Pendulispora albinea TaxID=2741071 RepID=A0ABZ2M312_9BACT
MNPSRGNREAYERYLKGMDASMRQKVALTAAHLLCTGKVADMGMGSGAGSHALAALYPMLAVAGVDLDPTMVEMARERFRLPNLEFLQGDIAARIFPARTLDGIFDSSVLHHVTTFGGYEHARAAACLANQADALKDHGVLVVRDFLAPNGGDDAVLLDLRADDGDDGADDPRSCSTARLFERFAREFRALHASPGFALETVASGDATSGTAPSGGAISAGWRRFRTTWRLATEFVLRKDYRTDWESEVKEEYTYFTQAEFEQLFARLGLRVLASTPIRNPWIVRHRFRGQFSARNGRGEPLEWPATNYIIAGEKVRPGEGVRFRETGSASALGFLRMDYYRSLRDGTVYDLVRRPYTSVDVVPYFELGGDVFVLARMSYPRPILCANAKSLALDESTPPHYVTEPLKVLQTDKPLGQTVEEKLFERANIPGARIRGFRAAGTYYPSPGGTQEEVRSVLVEVEPVFVEEDISRASGFSTSGRVRALEAEQVLRSAQVGGLPDARLELNVYDLLAQLGRAPGPWIGESIELSGRLEGVRTTHLGELAQRPSRRMFARTDRAASTEFLALHTGRFAELDAAGDVLTEASLEYVVPERLGTNTITCALLARIDGDIFMAADDDDLPAAQCFLGNSNLLVTPAWRIPKSIGTMGRARAWIAEQLAREYDVTLGETWELGGSYHPSAGISPEVAFLIAVEVLRQGDRGRPLHWFPLREVASHLEILRDGHLRIAALRAAHALGQYAQSIPAMRRSAPP